MNICPKCGLAKPRARPTRRICLECRNAQCAEWSRNKLATDPEYRERNKARQARQWEQKRNKLATDPEYRERNNAVQREWSRNKRATDPEYREAQNAREAERVRNKRATDPEYRERYNARKAERVRNKRATDPEWAKTCNAKAANWRRRKQRSGAPPGENVCPKCGEQKPRYLPWSKTCHDCYKNYHKEWHREHQEVANARKRQRMVRDPELAARARYATKRWRTSLRGRTWDRLKSAARRARERELGPVDLDFIEQRLKAQGGKCGGCQRPFGRRLKHTIDHIVPISKGGDSRPENLQLLCKSCNSSKGTLPEMEWRRRLGKLI